MTKPEKNIKILLVCDNEADILNIKARIQTLNNISCYVWQCPTLLEGVSYLDVKKLRADIIILDLGLQGVESPNELFHKMNLSAHNIPIIVITGKGSKEHNLAVFVMESGAADNMIRGEFSGLADAIEFALIRRKIENNLKSTNDQALQDSKDAGDIKYQQSCDQRSKDKKDNEHTLSMLMGDYSCSSNNAPKNKNDKK